MQTPLKIYEIEVPICAYTHIRAHSPEEAKAIFEQLDSTKGTDLSVYDEGLDQDVSVRPSIYDYSNTVARENPDGLNDDFCCANDSEGGK